MTLTAELPVKPKPHRITPAIAKELQQKQVILRNARRERAQFDADLTAKAEHNMPVISSNVRSNLAISVLRQSRLLSDQQVLTYKDIVGSKGKTGLMTALASLADSAAKVFQWSQEQNTQLISIGSFVQVNQSPTSVPNLSPNMPVIDITQQNSGAVVGDESMTGSVPVPE
jgi:hypothetical protein